MTAFSYAHSPPSLIAFSPSLNKGIEEAPLTKKRGGGLKGAVFPDCANPTHFVLR